MLIMLNGDNLWERPPDLQNVFEFELVLRTCGLASSMII